MSTSKGKGWVSALAPVIGMVAGVMVVAGIYLLDPAAIDFGFALDAGRTWLVGVYLIAAGFAFAYVLAWPKGIESGSITVDLLANFLIGEISHFVYGGISLAIGGQALFASPPNFWAAALLVPGLLSMTIALSDNKDKKEEAADEEGDATSPESGQVNFGATTLFLIMYGAIYAAYMFAAFVWIGLAFWLYYTLKAVILDGAAFDTTAAGASLWTVVVNALPTAAPLAIVIALVVVGIGVIGVLFQWLSQRGSPDGNRELSEAEIAYIDASAETVGAYSKAQGYDRNVWVIQAFGLVTVLGALGIGAAIAVFGSAIFMPPPAGPSFPIELRPGGFSAVGWIFVAIFLSPLPNSILSRLSRRYSERAGWVAIGVKNDYFSLKGKLTTFVRARWLSTATPINPGAFLHVANLSFERFFYVPAVALVAATLFFTHRDLNAVHSLTAEQIEVVNYWTLARERFSYGDVRQVELRCFLTGKGKTTEAYELQFKDGRTLNIFKKQAVVEAQLEAYEAVDAKLVALGVPFAPGPHQGLFKGDERGYDPACVETLVQEFPEALRDRVRRLFHLDDLKAVEDIWPWEPDIAEARSAADKYDVPKAVALYTKAIASGRLSGHLLAVAYKGRGQARDDYEVAFGIRDAHMALALGDYRKAREIEPTVQIYRDEASVLIALGAYDDAKGVYRKALDIERPKPHWSLIGLARVERIQGHYDAAMKHLDEVLRMWGEGNASMPIFYHRAWVLYLKNDDAGVVDAITHGLVYQPDYPGAFNRRACSQARLGNFAKAKEDMAQALKLAHAPPLNEAWEKTPYAAAVYGDFERDRVTIDAMAAGTASEEQRATLCADSWDYGEKLRTRSPLLPLPG